MHKVLPPASEMQRPCVFCDLPVIQAKGRLATSRKDGYGKTGMSHEECWAANMLDKQNAVSSNG